MEDLGEESEECWKIRSDKKGAPAKFRKIEGNQAVIEGWRHRVWRKCQCADKQIRKQYRVYPMWLHLAVRSSSSSMASTSSHRKPAVIGDC